MNFGKNHNVNLVARVLVLIHAPAVMIDLKCANVSVNFITYYGAVYQFEWIMRGIPCNFSQNSTIFVTILSKVTHPKTKLQMAF